jgi:hypothetical protein
VSGLATGSRRREIPFDPPDTMGTSDASATFFPVEMTFFERDQGSMRYAPLFSVFSRRLAFAGIAVLGLLATPSRSPAQDAGVSGIPPGPGNVNGLNGSVRDPSGIGNAARMPALPSPSVAPVVPPTASPSATYRAMPVQRSARVTRVRRTRFAKSRYGHAAEKAAVRENDRLLDRKLTSICRGC